MNTRLTREQLYVLLCEAQECGVIRRAAIQVELGEGLPHDEAVSVYQSAKYIKKTLIDCIYLAFL